jgi:hypothetical protein
MLLGITFTAWHTKTNATLDSTLTNGKLQHTRYVVGKAYSFLKSVKYSATLIRHKPVKFSNIINLMSIHIICTQTEICTVNVFLLNPIYIHYCSAPGFEVILLCKVKCLYFPTAAFKMIKYYIAHTRTYKVWLKKFRGLVSENYNLLLMAKNI